LGHDGFDVLGLEEEAILFVFDLDQVQVLQCCCVFDLSFIEDFALRRGALEVKVGLQIAIVAFFAVAHEDQIDWKRLVHLD